MAWRISKVEEQRRLFIEDVLSNKFSISELCREYQISRKTGYKWLERFKREGIEVLKDQSRAPLIQSSKTALELTEQIISVRKRFTKWGPKKILAYLQHNHPLKKWPSTTTIGKILDSRGLTNARKKRKRLVAKTDPLSHCQQPNDIWGIDFKGWFITKDGTKCDPHTLTDAYSRYLLFCRKLHYNTGEAVWEILDKAFYEYGLPKYIRHDNGPPFSTCGAGRLSRLSVKMIKAGITPEWIDPGKPHQNGRHERMHLTLKEEGIAPLKLTLEEQQMKFKDFQFYFNFERPHEALKQKPPGSVYVPSSRQWDGNLRSPEYDSYCQVKRVRECGLISWHGKDIYIGKVLKGECVGLKEDDEGDWQVYYGPVFLGFIDHRQELIQDRRRVRKKGTFKVRVY